MLKGDRSSEFDCIHQTLIACAWPGLIFILLEHFVIVRQAPSLLRFVRLNLKPAPSANVKINVAPQHYLELTRGQAATQFRKRYLYTINFQIYSTTIVFSP